MCLVRKKKKVGRISLNVLPIQPNKKKLAIIKLSCYVLTDGLIKGVFRVCLIGLSGSWS